MGSYTAGYHAAMKDNIDRILTEQPEYLALCYQYMKSLQVGAFDAELVNAIFQEWEQPLVVGVASPLYGEIEIEAPPTRAPLEVGYTSISTTMYHLNLERSLARWPYHSQSIYIFYCTDKWPDIREI
jgi:hypothetical protein